MSDRTAGRGRVLVVEDEAYVRDSLVEILRSRRFDASAAGSVAEAVAHLGRSPVDVVLSDLRMPGADGLELVRRMQTTAPDVPVVILTGHGNVSSAVECLKAGASDYVLKPAEPEALEVVLDRALEGRALRREIRYLRSAVAAQDEAAVGESAPWRRVLAMVEAAAASGSVVLFTGESGTGKELLARRLHALSARAAGPFVKVNCAAVPLEVWESEFFGHRKGSFAGAASDREGRFQLADRGTLLLDEVGAMPSAGQAKLLRVIQDGEFERLGDEQPTRVDVRVVASTNSDLEAEVQKGRFRADLFYLLNVVRIDVPPLRERRDDVPILARHFADQIALRLGRPSPELHPTTLVRLFAYSWPGNVREVRNVIERAMILDPARGLEDLDLAPAGASSSPPEGAPLAERELNLRDALNKLERGLLVEAHRRAGGVRKEAARLLGIDPRNLSYYMRKHDLDADSVEE
ncbi:MAG TPA: sigma-54 dependent transcriptional regulator [Vicinamibacteria bacterium]|nr:sigma-54 dependent transcriptional regulator [Vicinamibacteria bacterium]